MQVQYFGLVSAGVCALTFYRIGDVEYDRGPLLAGISLLVWISTAHLLDWGPTLSLVVQVGLYGVLTLVNLHLKPLPRSGNDARKR